jgi:hypothetical protein
MWRGIEKLENVAFNDRKALAVRFRLLDRACGAAYSADIGYSKFCSSPVLHRLKGAAQGFNIEKAHTRRGREVAPSSE